ncbi:unnamed protein product [Owenia fusiformis]|uniref:Uncharacterized protein n=1 Tax=Owenia fusiformis TaxID=6347 RepID=A0A8J1XZJ4_OWEFU|nr:unnamed protein product [Owenia fusiformis]
MTLLKNIKEIIQHHRTLGRHGFNQDGAINNHNNFTSNSLVYDLDSIKQFQMINPLTTSANIISGILLIPTFLVGLLGNVLVIFTFVKNKHLRTSNNTLITNLSVSDVFACGLAVPLAFAVTVINTSGNVLGLPWCKLQTFISTSCNFVTLITLIAISIERYKIIVGPQTRLQYFDARRKLATFTSWIVGVLIATLEVAIPNTTSTFFERCLMRKHLDEATVPLLMYTLVPLGVISLLLVTVVYVRIIFIVRKHVHPQVNKVGDLSNRPNSPTPSAGNASELFKLKIRKRWAALAALALEKANTNTILTMKRTIGGPPIETQDFSSFTSVSMIHDKQSKVNPETSGMDKPQSTSKFGLVRKRSYASLSNTLEDQRDTVDSTSKPIPNKEEKNKNGFIKSITPPITPKNEPDIVTRDQSMQSVAARRSMYIVTAFILSWAPLPIVIIAKKISQNSSDAYSQLFGDLETIGYCLMFSTRALHPVLYANYSKEFRREFSNMWRQLCHPHWSQHDRH